MEFIKGSRDEVEEQAVHELVHRIQDIVRKKGQVVLGIPGGRSVQGLFDKLKDADVDWSKVQVFWVDERWVPLSDPSSNYQMASFIERVPAANVHAFDYASSVDAYTEELMKAGGSFDIVILGVGEDGHVASLFPNHSISDASGVFIKVENAPKPPPKRMSASRELLEKAGTAFVLFFGEAKRRAFEDFEDDEVSVEDCPAKLANAVKNVYVVSDLNR